MRILFATDIHASQSHLETLIQKASTTQIDLLIVGGDIVPHHLPHGHGVDILSAQAIYLQNTLIPALKSLKARKEIDIYLDLSNDDFVANRRLLAQHEGSLLALLHMQQHHLSPNVDLLGYMMVPPTPFQRKDWEKPDARDNPYPPAGRIRLSGYITRHGRIEETVLNLDAGETIEADLAQLSEKIERPFIFVSHCPPWDTDLDMLTTGAHVGSVSIRRFIEQWSQKGQLIAALHGHIHEAPHVSGTAHIHINGVLCINPGQNEGPRAQLRYVVLEVDIAAHPPAVAITELGQTAPQ